MYADTKTYKGRVLHNEMEAIIETASFKLQTWLAGIITKSQELEKLHSLLNKETKCQHNIICECRRQNCLGRTLNVTTYIRRIQNA